MSSRLISVVLTSLTPVNVSVEDQKVPFTATLKSTGGAIKASTDGGNEFFAVTLDTDGTTATQKVFTVKGPLTHLQFTAATAGTDKYMLMERSPA